MAASPPIEGIAMRICVEHRRSACAEGFQRRSTMKVDVQYLVDICRVVKSVQIRSRNPEEEWREWESAPVSCVNLFQTDGSASGFMCRVVTVDGVEHDINLLEDSDHAITVRKHGLCDSFQLFLSARGDVKVRARTKRGFTMKPVSCAALLHIHPRTCSADPVFTSGWRRKASRFESIPSTTLLPGQVALASRDGEENEGMVIAMLESNCTELQLWITSSSVGNRHPRATDPVPVLCYVQSRAELRPLQLLARALPREVQERVLLAARRALEHTGELEPMPWEYASIPEDPTDDDRRLIASVFEEEAVCTEVCMEMARKHSAVFASVPRPGGAFDEKVDMEPRSSRSAAYPDDADATVEQVFRGLSDHLVSYFAHVEKCRRAVRESGNMTSYFVNSTKVRALDHSPVFMSLPPEVRALILAYVPPDLYGSNIFLAASPTREELVAIELDMAALTFKLFIIQMNNEDSFAVHELSGTFKQSNELMTFSLQCNFGVVEGSRISLEPSTRKIKWMGLLAPDQKRGGAMLQLRCPGGLQQICNLRGYSSTQFDHIKKSVSQRWSFDTLVSQVERQPIAALFAAG